jgi:hypothetical protein
VATAGLAELCTGDAKPLVVGGRCEHPLEQLAVGRLDLRSLCEGFAGAGDPPRQSIAHLLQLAEADQAWLARRSRGRRVDREARESLRREPRQLSLEAADLAPQLNTGKALVALYTSAGKGVSVEQLLHDPIRV